MRGTSVRLVSPSDSLPLPSCVLASSCSASLLLLLQLPKLLELVGLGYTSWFVYRYLLFKVRRGAVQSAV